jgi:hypothetical protein
MESNVSFIVAGIFCNALTIEQKNSPAGLKIYCRINNS